MNRRSYLGTAGAATLAGLAGCTGLLGMDEHEANPVGVAAETRADTGYEQRRVNDLVIEESVDMLLWSETVSVTNYLVEHEKSVSVGPLTDQRAAVFVALSTPKVSVLGQQLNPIEDMETARLVTMIAENYEGMGTPRHIEDEKLSVLDQQVVTSAFRTTATFAGGQEIEVNLHVTEAIDAGDDLVVGVGVYPRQLADRERPNVESLITSIDPSVDVEGESADGTNSSDGGENQNGLGL
ncbi:hypothetical protein Halru_0269 [Halovivax ruber XH-70]|uniref:Uncharacterized protein n=1 Tax=Halovivax ruber (strain DSM 18193 / JCM 13892 / XH-70) TaxID=797302 RepID=L0I5W7_HALRX|nr:DUF6517 family protein [Halovivax ruber]AGB14915.1 hypothetical protein Halru_0269 [Halovivax ruber XH-70]